MNYNPLKPGDVLQPGDQCHSDHGKEFRGGIPCSREIYFNQRYNDKENNWTNWKATNLVGQKLLASDFMHREYRRLV